MPDMQMDMKLTESVHVKWLQLLLVFFLWNKIDLEKTLRSGQ